jgi:hypothetical protein
LDGGKIVPANFFRMNKLRDMKIIVVSFLLLFGGYGAQAQSKTVPEKYQQLIELLGKEQWGQAEKNCKELLNRTETVDSFEMYTLTARYIHIFITAAQMNEKKLTQAAALARVKYLKGKEMVMPSHPFGSNCRENCTTINDKDKNSFFTIQNNEKGTQIFSFEYVKIDRGITESKEELEGRQILLKGVLDEISVEGKMLPRFKLKFTEGDYIVE